MFHALDLEAASAGPTTKITIPDAYNAKEIQNCSETNLSSVKWSRETNVLAQGMRKS